MEGGCTLWCGPTCPNRNVLTTAYNGCTANPAVWGLSADSSRLGVQLCPNVDACREDGEIFIFFLYKFPHNGLQWSNDKHKIKSNDEQQKVNNTNIKPQNFKTFKIVFKNT